MDLLERFLFAGFIILAAAIDEAQAETLVSGSVYCDQCKDGERSFLDYPIAGIKVEVTCANSDGGVAMSREETTNWMGNYVMRFDGSPDLSSCYAKVLGSEQGSVGCAAAAGPAQNLKLLFRIFDMEIYTADPLLSEPAKPMAFCGKSAAPVIAPAVPRRSPPPLPGLPPVTPLPSGSPPPSRHQPLPRLPPMPPLPPLPPMPPVRSYEASACSHEQWIKPEYKCYWRVVGMDTKVAFAFGLLAARRYGTDMTLWQALQGRGDPYATLLREGITAFLNSYNSPRFPYNAASVIQHMNWALIGSRRGVLLTALRFRKANSGNGRTTCKFNSCK